MENCGSVQLKSTSLEALYENLHEFKDDFCGEHNSGVTTFLYSVLLTKGLERIQSEFDMPDNSIIGHHGHCAQEQVNLFLTGRASSNCFDGDQDMDGMKLKGVLQRSEFGFLTIFEHFKYLIVG